MLGCGALTGDEEITVSRQKAAERDPGRDRAERSHRRQPPDGFGRAAGTAETEPCLCGARPPRPSDQQDHQRRGDPCAGGDADRGDQRASGERQGQQLHAARPTLKSVCSQRGREHEQKRRCDLLDPSPQVIAVQQRGLRAEERDQGAAPWRGNERLGEDIYAQCDRRRAARQVRVEHPCQVGAQERPPHPEDHERADRIRLADVIHELEPVGRRRESGDRVPVHEQVVGQVKPGRGVIEAQIAEEGCVAGKDHRGPVREYDADCGEQRPPLEALPGPTPGKPDERADSAGGHRHAYQRSNRSARSSDHDHGRKTDRNRQRRIQLGASQLLHEHTPSGAERREHQRVCDPCNDHRAGPHTSPQRGRVGAYRRGNGPPRAGADGLSDRLQGMFYAGVARWQCSSSQTPLALFSISRRRCSRSTCSRSTSCCRRRSCARAATGGLIA